MAIEPVAVEMVTRVVGQGPAATASQDQDQDSLDRGQVAALLELLREAVTRGRFVAVDTTLHGLCEGQGVNTAGIRWASERLAAELVDPKPQLKLPGSNSGPVVAPVTRMREGVRSS